MSLFEKVRLGIEALRTRGHVEVCEDGRWAAELSPWEYELKQRGSRAVLHVWGSERHLTRCVLRVLKQEPSRLIVEVERFGQRKPGRLEFTLRDKARPGGRVEREQFRNRLARLLAEQFPEETIWELTSAQNLERSLSGSYARGVMGRGQEGWAVIGAAEGESGATIDGALTYGLIWLDQVRELNPHRAIAGLRLFLPEGGSRTTVMRLRGLTRSVAFEVYEIVERTGKARQLDVSDIGNLTTRLVPKRQMEEELAQAEPTVAKIRQMSPDAIAATMIPGSRGVGLRFRGLEFARWNAGGLVLSIGENAGRLCSPEGSAIRELVRQLQGIRDPQSEDRSHPFYRVSAERWLETQARQDISRIDALLDEKRVYSQVPALTGGDRGVMDLVGVKRDGRLVVIELKADEDIHLVMQAVDYWTKVTWHLGRGDFQSYGYFGEIELQMKAPLLYLVAPALRFHPTTDLLLRFVAPEIEVVRVGVNEDWRQGLRVVFRQ